MSIFVKYYLPGIFYGHVQHDETAIFAPLKQAGNLGGLALPQWRKLAQLFRVAEGNNLQRYWKVDVGLGQQRSKDCAHLLKTHGGLTPALLTGIGNHGEVRGANLYPLRPVSVCQTGEDG